MALHRDILWIGRQWAVTGHGMQLIDQRLMGAFDIEVGRLWDDDLIERMHAKEWLNAADFDKGLAVARTRHPQPQAVSTSVVAPSAPAIEPIAPPTPPAPPEAANPQPLPIELPKQESPDLQMKIDGGARFARPWRVWMKKT
jgi:hypothetical protein